MGNYPTYYCSFNWSVGKHPDLGDRVLRSQPHRGDAVWIPMPEEGFNYLVRISDVIHVAETNREFPYLEVWVSLEERQKIKAKAEDDYEEETDERGCDCGFPHGSEGVVM
jgi:hypothetical protein